MLDVSLSRKGLTRRWTISAWEKGWSCRYIDRHSVSFSGCDTLALALAKKDVWEAEIIVARADGWS